MSDDTNGREPGEPPPPLDMQRSLARTITNPAVKANQAIIQWSGLAGTPFDRGLLLELEAQVAAIQAGNLDQLTAVLTAHVETLNAIFYALIRSAHEHRGGPHEDATLKLAMRVQARIAATVQKLVDIKSPRPVAYVQQANIGNAVQVNNAQSAVAKTPNELLEQQRNEWLDRRTSSTTIGADRKLETLG